MWAEPEFPPHEGGFEQPLFLRSDDGVRWEESHAGLPGRVVAVAGGPDGWVAIGHHGYGGSSVVHSLDGRDWSEPQATDVAQYSVAHGGGRFVMVGADLDGRVSTRRSDDGRTWDAPVIVASEGSPTVIEAGDAGYLLFDPSGEAGYSSVDGATWHRFRPETADPARISDVELVGTLVLVDTVDLDQGTSAIYHGTLGSDGTVSWGGVVDRAPFEGHRVDSISMGADGLIALGWDHRELVPATWTSDDGISWTKRVVAADTFGGMIGAEPAWGAGGWIGHGIDAQGDTLWRSTDGASWSFAGRPEPMELADPRCPSASAVATLDLIFLRDRGYDCFGGASLTIRAWVPLTDGIGGCCFPVAQPEWLAGAFPQGFLTAGEVDHLSLQVFIPPDVDDSALDAHTWVEVVGHFGDPEATSCRHFPQSSIPMQLESRELVRDQCLRRFVVERLSPVEGP